MNKLSFVLSVGWIIVAVSRIAPAQAPATVPSPDQAIIETIRSYVDAYNLRDVDAVANHWAENAVMLAIDSQEKIVGREAIREDLARQFEADPKSQLEVNVTSIRLVTDSVAVEDGFATVLRDGNAFQSTYTVVHIKQKDGWKIDSVRDAYTIFVMVWTSLKKGNAPLVSSKTFDVGSWCATGLLSA